MNPREELGCGESLLWAKSQDLCSVLAALRQAGDRIPLERRHRPGRQRFLQPRLALLEHSLMLTPLGEQRRKNVCAQRDVDRKAAIIEMTNAECCRPNNRK